jgi:hypothetical protein
MKKYLLLVLAFLFVVAPAYAGSLEHEFTIGPELSHITYKEPGVMTEKGWFYGIAGSYTLKVPVLTDMKVTVGPEFKLAKGKVDYNSPISGSLNGIDDVLFEARLLGGAEFQVTKDMALRPYTGFGYRSLVDDSQGMTTSTGAWGYKRWIRYYYIPVGVAYSYGFAQDWKLKAYAEYDLFLRGKVTSYLGYLPGYEDIKNTQKSGYGLRAGLNVSKKFTSWSVSFGPYVKYWKIKDSQVTTDSYGRGWIEPRNHSTEIGGALTVNF